MVGMQAHATALADAVEAALPGWVERSVEQVLIAARGSVDVKVMAAATTAGRRAADEVGGAIRSLLAVDIDEQRANPLALLRAAASYPAKVLLQAGVPPVERDPNQVRLLPDDVYDLAPARFADLGPEVGELGLVWGAAKAHEHMRRHGGEQTPAPPAPPAPVAPSQPPAPRPLFARISGTRRGTAS